MVGGRIGAWQSRRSRLDPHQYRSAQPLAPARARVRRRPHVQAAVRVPARLLAVGGSARPRAGPGDAAGRQEGRDDHRGRAGRPLRDPAARFPTATTPASIRGTICTTIGGCGSALDGWLRQASRDLGRPRVRTPRPCADAACLRRQRSRASRSRAVCDVLFALAVRSATERRMSDQFGFERVTPDEKTRRVRGVFDSVAGKYDVMNDVMSGGLHRLWKRFAVDLAAPCGPASACSTSRAAPATSRGSSPPASAPSGVVVHTDINHAMLGGGPRQAARPRPRAADRAVQRGSAAVSRPRVRRRVDRVRPAQRDAQGSGARRDAPRAAPGRRRDRARILARGGAARARLRLVQLQRAAAARPADRAATTASYRYLAESIRVHPDQADAEAR